MLPNINCPTSANYGKNFQRVTQGDPCAVCGRGITRGAKYIALDLNTNEIIDPTQYQKDIENGFEDNLLLEGIGEHPIGSDCLRRNPQLRPYTL